jgi:hypothetical protein
MMRKRWKILRSVDSKIARLEMALLERTLVRKEEEGLEDPSEKEEARIGRRSVASGAWSAETARRTKKMTIAEGSGQPQRCFLRTPDWSGRRRKRRRMPCPSRRRSRRP